MNYTKKIIVIVLCALVLSGFMVACGEKKEEPNSPGTEPGSEDLETPTNSPAPIDDIMMLIRTPYNYKIKLIAGTAWNDSLLSDKAKIVFTVRGETTAYILKSGDMAKLKGNIDIELSMQEPDFEFTNELKFKEAFRVGANVTVQFIDSKGNSLMEDKITVSAPEVFDPVNYPDVLSRMLHVEGNKVFNDLGEEVMLYGAAIPSMEWYVGDWIEESVYEILSNADWNCNLVRIPLCQNRWFGDTDYQQDPSHYHYDPNGAKYRAKVDNAIDIASKLGKYIEIDLHWSDGGGGYYLRDGVQTQNPLQQWEMPDLNSLEFWIDVAQTYKNHPAVLFDLYNEPQLNYNERHEEDLWKNGGTISVDKTENGTRIQYDYETPGMQGLVDEIRKIGANNVVIAGGMKWAFDLTMVLDDQYALDDFVGNGIIYDAHLYPWRGQLVDSYDQSWHDAITAAKDKYPIMIGEFGPVDNADEYSQKYAAAYTAEYGWDTWQKWLEGLLDWMGEHGYHWNAWAFSPTAGPCMISTWPDNAEPFKTTEYGQIMQNRLSTYPNISWVIAAAELPPPGMTAEKTDTFRINCGGDTYTDHSGNIWEADHNYFEDWHGCVRGDVYYLPGPYQATELPELYPSLRGGAVIKYQFDDIWPGRYNIKIYTSEPTWTDGDPRARQFNVYINNGLYAENLCPSQIAGQWNAIEIEYVVEVKEGGQLVIILEATKDLAVLNALEITPAKDAELSPIIGSDKYDPFKGLKDYVKDVRPDFKVGAYYIMYHNPDDGWQNDPTGTNTAIKNFNFATLWASMGSTQPVEGIWDFKEFQARLNYLKGYDIDTCIHMLAGWNTYNPGWLTNGNYDADDLENILDTHIQAVMERYGGEVYAAHVFNEAFEWSGALYGTDRNKWLNMGTVTTNGGYTYPKFLEVAFAKAREYGGAKVELIYNDSGNAMAGSSNRAQSALDLFVNFKKIGIPIDGVGIQLHLYVQNGKLYEDGGALMDWDKFTEQMNLLGEAGAIVHITEFEVALESNPTQDDYQMQAATYAEAFKRCIENPYCELFQVWYANDAYSPSGNAGMFDENWKPKSAYYAILDYLISAGETDRKHTYEAATGADKIINITESTKGQWLITFTVELKYEDGSVKVVEHTIEIGKNSDGKIDLGEYTLRYDIKGNGSNVKVFEILKQ